MALDKEITTKLCNKIVPKIAFNKSLTFENLKIQQNICEFNKSLDQKLKILCQISQK
jgi:hypothetical protein